MPLFVVIESTKCITAPPTGTEKTRYWKESPVLAAALSGLEYLIKFKGGSKQRGVPSLRSSEMTKSDKDQSTVGNANRSWKLIFARSGQLG